MQCQFAYILGVHWCSIFLFIACIINSAQSNSNVQCDINLDWRIDCYPESSPQLEEHCTSRGCCYQPHNNLKDDVPWCFYPSNYSTYQLSNFIKTTYGYNGILTLNSSKQHSFGPLLNNLSLDIFLETKERLRFRIRDLQNLRYEVPISTPSVQEASINSKLYDVNVTSNRFGIIITRKRSGSVIFNSTVAPLVYADQFLQISTSLPSKYIYGIGERHEHALVSTDWQRNVFWARDQKPKAKANLYGDHPVYIGIEKDGHSHGVFFLNSNAKEVVTQPAPALTWRSIGGILDFYIFLGPTFETVVQQYTDVIGKPFLPPYWSLGFHLCRWGYHTANRTLNVVERMRAANIPQDVQWNDIDYMSAHLDFTYNPVTFKHLPEVVESLHNAGQRYMMIIDPGISNTQSNGSYSAYDDGIAKGIFIKDKVGGKPIEGAVWPGKTVFPDFTHPDVEAYWESQLLSYHAKVPFDGVWLDMNEPSNFIKGSTSGCPNNKYENPVYVPRVTGGSLSARTLCSSSAHYNTTHYDIHSLTGLLEMKATYAALKSIRGTRPFIISRSTFPSAGMYGGHWTGDIVSTWADMKQSIASVINFNMFGIPMIGADICGFSGETTEELCTRWMQLGAFYPFSRNHNYLLSRAQAPVDFSPEAQTNMRDALLLRYSFLPYLYSLFFMSHVNGTTVARGLFSVFPNDKVALSIDQQFMWGDALLISPVLSKGSSNVTAYFPAGNWYEITGSFGKLTSSDGKWIEVNAPISKIPLHARGGSIMLTQTPSTTTTKSRSNPTTLIVAPDEKETAYGILYWDDGSSLQTYENRLYLHVDFSLKNNTFVSSVVHAADGIDLILSEVYIFNVNPLIKFVYINGKLISSDRQMHNVLHFKCSLSLRNKFVVQFK